MFLVIKHKLEIGIKPRHILLLSSSSSLYQRDLYLSIPRRDQLRNLFRITCKVSLNWKDFLEN